MSSQDSHRISPNKIRILQALWASSLNLLHKMSQCVAACYESCDPSLCSHQSSLSLYSCVSDAAFLWCVKCYDLLVTVNFFYMNSVHHYLVLVTVICFMRMELSKKYIPTQYCNPFKEGHTTYKTTLRNLPTDDMKNAFLKSEYNVCDQCSRKLFL
jgi:hypothetical protein